MVVLFCNKIIRVRFLCQSCNVNKSRVYKIYVSCKVVKESMEVFCALSSGQQECVRVIYLVI